MKYLLRFGIAACLTCSAFVLAQSSATSTERKQEPPASDSNAQEPKQPRASQRQDLEVSTYLRIRWALILAPICNAC